MTVKKYEFENHVSCSPQWVDDSYYKGEAEPCSGKNKIIINAPPKDGACYFCHRHVSELAPFGGPDDDFFGAKLVKSYRYDHPSQVGATWECRDCFMRPEPLWWITFEEEQLGRRLTDSEVVEIQRKFELEAERYDREMAKSEPNCD